MELFIQVNGTNKIKDKEKGFNIGKMDLSIKGTGKMIWLMDQED